MMRNGFSPTAAADAAIQRIASKYPWFGGAVIAVNSSGDHGIMTYFILEDLYCSIPYKHLNVASRVGQSAVQRCENAKCRAQVSIKIMITSSLHIHICPYLCR
jgi:hypothetical protein